MSSWSNTRVRVLSAAAVLLALLVVVAGTVPVPLVSLGPGPSFDVLGQVQGKPVISVTGRPVYPTTGHLNMTTVTVNDGLTAVTALGGWLSRQDRLVPRAAIYPPGLTNDQVTQQNSEMFSSSESDATAAALSYLRQPVQVVVGQMTAGSPPAGVLRVGDRLLQVDGQPVSLANQVRTIMGTTAPGQRVPITYQRAGAAPVSGTVTVGTRPDDGLPAPGPAGPKGFLGIVARSEPVPPDAITVALDDVGGPSAGLMFALGIIDKISPSDLTGGRFVAGTGTIDELGRVGEISGIAQKMIGARSQGATVFLVPGGDCEEARDTTPDGLTLVRVDTLGQAVDRLGAVKAGRPVPGC